MPLYGVIFIVWVLKLFKLLCLSEDAFPFVEKILPNYKYLQTLINKTPSSCSQSEDVDLLLVSGENAFLKRHMQGNTQNCFCSSDKTERF
jgi:hypothetical protein